MNEQVLSPSIENALAQLRQAIAAELAAQQAAPATPVSAPAALVDIPTAPATPVMSVSPISPAAPVGFEPVSPVAPVTPATSTLVEPVTPVMPTPAAAIPTPAEPVSLNLPDLGASPNSVADLSGLPPAEPVSLAANNGLDESLPIAPPQPTPAASPYSAVEQPVMPAPTLPDLSQPAAPAGFEPVSPVAPEMPTPAPEAAPVSQGLPKANSLLNNVLKKGWSSSQQ